MKTTEHDRIRSLLQQALAPVVEDADSGPKRDLWPELERRIEQAEPDVTTGRRVIPWFDWALAGGIAMVAVAFPWCIPVLLYYL